MLWESPTDTYHGTLNDSNERAYDLLKWQTVLEPAGYDELIDYFSVWKKRSDQAIDLFDKQNEPQPNPRATATATGSIDLPSTPRRGNSQDGEGERLAPDNAQQGLRTARPRRPKRR